MSFDVSAVEFSPKDVLKGISLPRKITTHLAYFCGILAGDGSIYSRSSKFDHVIKCVGDPKKEQALYVDVLGPIMRRLFSFAPVMKLQDGGTTFGFCVYSKALYTFFTHVVGLPSGKKYATLRIPAHFSKEPYVNHFIRGVADTDFYVKIVKKNYPVIVGVSKSERFIRDIAAALKMMGFTYGLCRNVQHDPRFKAPTVTYELSVSGRENLRLWMKKIGFSSPKHLARVSLVKPKERYARS